MKMAVVLAANYKREANLFLPNNPLSWVGLTVPGEREPENCHESKVVSIKYFSTYVLSL